MKTLKAILTAALWFTAVQAQIPVPETGCYHSAFTPNVPSMGAYGHADFEALAKKKIAIEMFYVGWATNKVPDFPSGTCNAIVAAGSIPHVTWEPWTTGSPYPLDGILSGGYINYLAGYARAVKAWGKPLFLRIGHEMNGNWYPWCGANNGGSTLTGFGDPAKPDGPERFVAAYRYIHRVFDSIGVTNAVWIWCPNNYPEPKEAWNASENFYPGDDVVDWIGFDGYNWGTSQTWSGWANFLNVFQDIYNRFKSYPKPLMIGEYASAEAGGDKGVWIRDAYLYTKLLFPRIKAITWFNINKETDWRVNSTGNALSAYQLAVSDPYFLSSVPATSVPPVPAGTPKDFVLDPAYPNPFNGSVTVSFAMPAAAPVRMRIADAMGRTVYEESIAAAAGRNYFRWNGTDRNGSCAVSGCYFLSGSTSLTTQTQKLLYLK